MLKKVEAWGSEIEKLGLFGTSGKNPTANARDISDAGFIPGLRRFPGGGHGNPLQYSCLENPHGQNSLAGYRPQGLKSDTTEATWLALTLFDQEPLY